MEEWYFSLKNETNSLIILSNKNKLTPSQVSRLSRYGAYAETYPLA